MTVNEIMENVIRICHEHHVREAYLFGSRAKGTATARSDFDLSGTGAKFSTTAEKFTFH